MLQNQLIFRVLIKKENQKLSSALSGESKKERDENMRERENEREVGGKRDRNLKLIYSASLENRIGDLLDFYGFSTLRGPIFIFERRKQKINQEESRFIRA